MRGLAGAPGLLEHKKTASYPLWDKSCTPAIPPKLTFWKRPLASRAITRARWITGGSPSASTWSPVQAALESPFARPRPALIPPPKALLRFALPATILSHRFDCCSVVVAIIAAPPPVVNPQIFNSLKKILGHTAMCPTGSFAVTVRNIRIYPPLRPVPGAPGTGDTPPADNWRSRADRWCRRER